MKSSFRATVRHNRSIAPGIHELVFEGHEAMSEAHPGQFVHISASDALDPLLRRPMSICSVIEPYDTGDAKTARGCWSVIFRVKGAGTKKMASLQAGADVDVLGPLGSGFVLPQRHEQPLLVGGGLGVAPLVFLAQRLQSLGWRPHVMLGFSTRDEVICVEQFERLGLVTEVTTDDGSWGECGQVVGLLTSWSGSGPVYTCGPLPMMNCVVQWCRQRGLSCQVSLEERMACGVGACLSCVCPIRPSGDKSWIWQRICKEGPVFNGLEVAFDVLCG
ncbi:MAG: dihydroorotate dehydrogenase electron transfer subunit [Firmicutes bacterium]|jgi:dihydroorotate dehydrogenase electron transfer subunit|nr:dihydroorotate dehydrogenase electron transfer subunit [Bacillota bacterium]